MCGPIIYLFLLCYSRCRIWRVSTSPSLIREDLRKESKCLATEEPVSFFLFLRVKNVISDFKKLPSLTHRSQYEKKLNSFNYMLSEGWKTLQFTNNLCLLCVSVLDSDHPRRWRRRISDRARQLLRPGSETCAKRLPTILTLRLRSTKLWGVTVSKDCIIRKAASMTKFAATMICEALAPCDRNSTYTMPSKSSVFVPSMARWPRMRWTSTLQECIRTTPCSHPNHHHEEA